jgi:hypothetical protein
MKALSALVTINRLSSSRPTRPAIRRRGRDRCGKLNSGHERDTQDAPIQPLGSDASHHSSWDKPVIVVKTLPG